MLLRGLRKHNATSHVAQVDTMPEVADAVCVFGRVQHQIQETHPVSLRSQKAEDRL